MPLYRLVPIRAVLEPDGEQAMFYNDAAAITRALGARFPQGCEVWQGLRFVGRFHRAAGAPSPVQDAAGPAETAEASDLAL